MKSIMKNIIRVLKLLEFVVTYIFELIKSNIFIAGKILSVRPQFNPGIIRIELDAKSDTEILSLANLISMTPGTMTMDVSEDRKYIFVHVMELGDIEAMKSEIKNNLEKRILRITR